MDIKLRLSDMLYDELELMTPEGMRLERFVEKMLPILIKVNTDRPYIILNGDQLEKIQALFGGHTFKDGNDIVDTMKRTQTFRLMGTMDITLDMDIIQQLRQQSEGMGVPFEKYMRDNVNEALMFLTGVPIQSLTVPR